MKKNIIIPLLLLILSCACDSAMNMETLAVKECYPGENQYNIPLNASVRVSFSTDVKKGDVEEMFSLYSSKGDVEGEFQWESGSVFVFVPSEEFDNSTRYSIYLSRTVRDKDGNKMKQDFMSDFYTGDDLDFPSVISSDPPYIEGGAPNISLDQDIVIAFSEAMNRIKTESAFSLSPEVSGYFSWNGAGTVLTFVTTAEMDYGTRYTLTISDSAEDLSGNPLQDTYKISFITGDDFDIPGMLGIYDALLAPITDPNDYWQNDTLNEGVSRGVNIEVEFDESMDRSSVESAFSLSPSVAGVFYWNAASEIVTFVPNELLESDRVYLVTVDSSAMDLNGRTLDSDYNVYIRTNEQFSQYIKVNTINGSHDDEASDPYTSNNLVSITPIGWPCTIDMGSITTPYPLDGDPHNYFLSITFIDEDETAEVEMNMYSLMENILIESYSEGFPGSVDNIYRDNPTDPVIVDLISLSNVLVETPAVLYRITIVGGETGVKDINGNTMRDDFVFEIKEP